MKNALICLLSTRYRNTTENIPIILFLNIQVLHSVITIQDHIVMRYACIVLTTILLLLLDLVIVLGDEAFATIEFPNMTLTEPNSGFTPVQNVSTPTSLEQLAMNAPPSNISQQQQQQQQQPLPPPSNISQQQQQQQQQQPLPPPSNISQQQQQQQQPLPPPSNISQQLAATTTSSRPGYAAATTNLSAATIQLNNSSRRLFISSLQHRFHRPFNSYLHNH